MNWRPAPREALASALRRRRLPLASRCCPWCVPRRPRDTSLAELLGMGVRVPNPHLLMAPYMRQWRRCCPRASKPHASQPVGFSRKNCGLPRPPARPMPMHRGAQLRAASRTWVAPAGRTALSPRAGTRTARDLMQGVARYDLRNPAYSAPIRTYRHPRSRIETAHATVPPPPGPPAAGLPDAWGEVPAPA